jgi:hypothetical protein
MDMSRILPTFKRLRWKPTLSYTAVTVVVLLTVSAAGWLIVLLTDTPSATMDYSQSLAVAKAAEARPFLEATLPDSTLLELWLQNAITDEWFVIVSPSGEPLAANVAEAADEALLRQPFVDSNAPDESRQLIDQALIEKPINGWTIFQEAWSFLEDLVVQLLSDSSVRGKPEVLGLRDGTILAAAPILGEGETVLGVLCVRGFSDGWAPTC